MSDIYLEYLLDHYKHPRNYGSIEDADISHQEGNPLCGDEIRFDIKLKEGKIEQVKFRGRGCAISLAAASILTEMIQGKSLEEARSLSKEQMLQALHIPIGPTRMKCALLALKVFKAGAYGISSWPGEEEEKK
ncbi:MAG: Fe-S cluster assembly sulfur transfer protein SufU [bacterium JZ-2024 1]